MSANFTGVTFPNQKVTPANDAVIRRAIFDDGILTGCDLSYSGSTLTMTAGQLMICGRQIIHPSSQNWAVTEATSGYARLVLTIDVTRTSTKDTFDQVVDEVQYATAANGFTDLTQDDINAAGTRYQVAVCVVSLGPGGITGIVSKLDMTEGGGAGGVLTVLTIAGKIVTVSKGDEVKTGIAGVDGTIVIKGLAPGKWVASIPAGDGLFSRSVDVEVNYSVDLFPEIVLYDTGVSPIQYTVLDGTAQEKGTYLLIQGPTSGVARTGAIAYLGIDLTDYSEIEITYSNLTSAASASLRVFTGDSYSSAGTVAILNLAAASGTFTLDVSSLTGNYGIRLAVYNEEATPSIRLVKLRCVW